MQTDIVQLLRRTRWEEVKNENWYQIKRFYHRYISGELEKSQLVNGFTFVLKLFQQVSPMNAQDKPKHVEDWDDKVTYSKRGICEAAFMAKYMVKTFIHITDNDFLLARIRLFNNIIYPHLCKWSPFQHINEIRCIRAWKELCGLQEAILL